MRIKEYRDILLSIQSRVALRVISVYRTISGVEAIAIAGTIPIDLFAEERKRVYDAKTLGAGKEAKTQERMQTMRQWEEQWRAEIRGRWAAEVVG